MNAYPHCMDTVSGEASLSAESTFSLVLNVLVFEGLTFLSLGDWWGFFASLSFFLSKISLADTT